MFMKNGHWFSFMGHTKVVALVGIAASILILVLMPNARWAAGLTLGVVLLHVSVLFVLSFSVLMVLPQRLRLHVARLFRKKEKSFDAGWSVGWMNGFWIAATFFFVIAFHIYLSFPDLRIISFIFFPDRHQLFYRESGNPVC